MRTLFAVARNECGVTMSLVSVGSPFPPDFGGGFFFTGPVPPPPVHFSEPSSPSVPPQIFVNVRSPLSVNVTRQSARKRLVQFIASVTWLASLRRTAGDGLPIWK